MRQKRVYWSHFFLSSVPDHDQFFSGFCRIYLNRVIITAYYVSKGRLLKRRKMDVEGKVFGCVKRNCKWSCQIFNLLEHRNNFDWKNFWKKVNFYIDLYIWQKIFISCQNYFNQVVKTAFYVTQKNNLLRNKFIGNIIFLFSFRHWWKFFGFASASFRWSSQNSNQSVQGNVLKKVIFSQNSNFFIFFGFSTRKFPRFFRRLYAGSTVLHSTCPKELFEEIFSETHKVFNSFVRCAGKFGDLPKSSRQGCQIRPPRVN